MNTKGQEEERGSVWREREEVSRGQRKGSLKGEERVKKQGSTGKSGIDVGSASLEALDEGFSLHLLLSHPDSPLSRTWGILCFRGATERTSPSRGQFLETLGLKPQRNNKHLDTEF